MVTTVLAPGSAVLFVAHPGHELCLHDWLERTRAQVFVLTDGSGSTGRSRLGSTTRLVERCGAQIGSVYGRFRDAEVYPVILDQDVEAIAAIVREVADALVTREDAYLVADPWELYNPSHDLCRAIANLARTLAARGTARRSAGSSVRRRRTANCAQRSPLRSRATGRKACGTSICTQSTRMDAWIRRTRSRSTRFEGRSAWRRGDFQSRAEKPTNLYGPNDNFDLTSSHVLPAPMRKFHEARWGGGRSVSVWGSGQARREFLHVDDLADACLFLMRHYDGALHLNIGTGNNLTIEALARMVGSIVYPDAEILFDHSKPDGTPRKQLAVTRLHGLGWKHRIDLPDGMAATYSWFTANQSVGVVPSPA